MGKENGGKGEEVGRGGEGKTILLVEKLGNCGLNSYPCPVQRAGLPQALL